MTHAEFFRQAREIVGRNVYLDAHVSAIARDDGAVRVEFSVYTKGEGWTQDHANPQDALAELRCMFSAGTPAELETVGDVAAELAADGESQS